MPGAPAGEYIVVIVRFPKDSQPDPATAEMRNTLPAIYADPKESPLRATIKKEANDLAPFKLLEVLEYFHELSGLREVEALGHATNQLVLGHELVAAVVLW